VDDIDSPSLQEGGSDKKSARRSSKEAIKSKGSFEKGYLDNGRRRSRGSFDSTGKSARGSFGKVDVSSPIQVVVTGMNIHIFYVWIYLYLDYAYIFLIRILLIHEHL
jgi:hypothetical protein